MNEFGPTELHPHLLELRVRLRWAAFDIALTTLVVYLFWQHEVAVLLASILYGPILSTNKDIVAAFEQLRFPGAIGIGFLIGIQLLLFQLAWFILPGLQGRERPLAYAIYVVVVALHLGAILAVIAVIASPLLIESYAFGLGPLLSMVMVWKGMAIGSILLFMTTLSVMTRPIEGSVRVVPKWLKWLLIAATAILLQPIGVLWSAVAFYVLASNPDLFHQLRHKLRHMPRPSRFAWFISCAGLVAAVIILPAWLFVTLGFYVPLLAIIIPELVLKSIIAGGRTLLKHILERSGSVTGRLLRQVLPPLGLCAPPPPALTDLSLDREASRVLVLCLFGLMGILGAAAISWTNLVVPGRARFVSQMILFVTSLCFIPTASYTLTHRYGRVARVALESVLLIALICGFGVWLFGLGGIGVWVVGAALIILLLEIGSHLVDHFTHVCYARAKRYPRILALKEVVESVQRIYRSELILYIAVILGPSIGIAIGLVAGWTETMMLVACAQITLLLASILLLLFLGRRFLFMVNPLLGSAFHLTPEVAEARADKAGGFFEKLMWFAFIMLSPFAPSSDEHKKQQDLSLALAVTDLRQVHLFDSIHNATLLVAFLAVVLNLWNFPVRINAVIFSLAVAVFICSQIPFAIGQSRLHDIILARYEGVSQAEMAQRLREYAPLFPTSHLVTSLIAAGTAGGLLYALLEEVMKSVLP